MQDIHSIGSGGGGRLFGGGADRRMRPHHNQNHQALKCPRCESSNTKFCYYNNYNLSQPRHFCKGCRRYWTKGGVLRNVPVGGGCRKTKRSKPKPLNSSDVPPRERESINSQNSSSDSSSLTANTTTTTKTPVTTPSAGNGGAEVLSGSSSNSASTLLNFQDSRFYGIPQSSTPNPSFDPPLMEQPSENGMFAEIGTFTSLMTSSSNDPLPLGFNMSDLSGYRVHQGGQGRVVEDPSTNQQWQVAEEEAKMQEMGMGVGFMDQTARIEFSGLQNRGSNDGLAAVDWQAGAEQGLFDLTATVDQSYWSQTQWTDHDHPLHYLP